MILGLCAAALGADSAIFPPPVDPEPVELYPGTLDKPPVKAWRVDLPGGVSHAATHAERSAPLVVGDVLLIGSSTGEGLFMLSRRTGSLIRTFPAKDSVESQATVDGKNVYFGDTGGYSWCYRLDGELVWSHEGTAPILSRPTVSDGRVIVADVDDLVVSLDAGTGELAWHYQAKRDVTRAAELALYGAPPPVVVDGLALLGFSDGTLAGVDAVSGEEQWTKRIGEGRYPDVVAEIVPQNGIIYAAGYYKPVEAFDLATRTTIWRIDQGAAFGVAVADTAAGTVVYQGSTDGKVRAISGLTGAERWVWDSGDTGAMTTPVVSPAGLLVGSSVGPVYLIDPTTGKEIWRISEPYLLNGVSAAPVVDGRQLLVVTNAGHLFSFLAPLDRPEPAWPGRVRGD